MSEILEWDPDLETGVSKIDEQHKELFSRIYRMREAAKNGMSAKEVYATLVFFRRYVSEHFSDEEKLQQESSYPQYEQHKAAHTAFINKMEKLFDKTLDEEITLLTVLEVNKTVYDWLSEHINKVDMAFASYYRKGDWKTK